MPPTEGPGPGPGTRYSFPARLLHWVVAAFVIILIPLGLYMVDRGEVTNFDAVTGDLYSLHKLLGFIVIWLIALRLLVRLSRRPPAPVATLTPLERVVSDVVHALLYLLLIVVPLLGWAGVSAYPALNIFGLFDLPALLGPDEPLAKRLFDAHGLLAKLLGLLALLHIAAALMHRVVKKDGVMRRMWPL